jgi:hypothetical protein
VKGAHHAAVGGEFHLKVEKLQAIEIGDSRSLKVAGDVHQKVGGGQFTEVAGDVSITASNIVLKAAENITLRVGNTYLAIDNTGIKLFTDNQIQVEGDFVDSVGHTGASLQSDVDVSVTGATASFSSSGQMEIRGAIIQIN